MALAYLTTKNGILSAGHVIFAAMCVVASIQRH